MMLLPLPCVAAHAGILVSVWVLGCVLLARVRLVWQLVACFCVHWFAWFSLPRPLPSVAAHAGILVSVCVLGCVLLACVRLCVCVRSCAYVCAQGALLAVTGSFRVPGERDLANETWQTRPGKTMFAKNLANETWQTRPGKRDLANETWQTRPWQKRPLQQWYVV